MSFCAPPRAKSLMLASLARIPKVTPLKNPRSANATAYSSAVSNVCCPIYAQVTSETNLFPEIRSDLQVTRKLTVKIHIHCVS